MCSHFSRSMENLIKYAANLEMSVDSSDFAKYLDECDALRHFRDLFHLPLNHEGDHQAIYLLGNSLGLQPKRTKQLVKEELEVWAEHSNEGHFNHPYGPERNWTAADVACSRLLVPLVGAASEDEIAVMGTLTSNLHHLMTAFYQPTPPRHKIIIEAKPFPSDLLLVESQIRIHGLNPKDSLVILDSDSDGIISHETILETIKSHGDSIALILISAVHYCTGQLFDVRGITEAGHAVGAIVGFDLAHAIGNVPLYLHEWQVDFAAWCNYKYLNAGPGAIAGIFVHSKHFTGNPLEDKRVPRGWWGLCQDDRFRMTQISLPLPGAKGFCLSNPCALSLACLRSSLEIFSQTTMEAIRAKSHLMTRYFRMLLYPCEVAGMFTFITPQAMEESGAQLSLRIRTTINGQGAAQVHRRCKEYGIYLDKRDPNILRITPVALYNTFLEIHEAAMRIRKIFAELYKKT